ncbi:hypothetical protein R1sor_014825 [Riccia sorocarpa]|uniref:Uncharacterized protein n=1 Tax=Riccia sorocarpa TaxID=122646 RepID=A0ABD3HCC4_9MARC
MADAVDSSDPHEMVDTVLQELEPGVTPSGSISTPTELADDPGHVNQTFAARKIQPKRGNIAKKNGGSSSSQVSPLTTQARARQKAGLDKVQEAVVDPIEELGRIPKLVPYLQVRNLQNISVMIEALKRSFETHCYMENGAGFHICPFDETGNYVDVTDADKEKWDDLWRMESEAFDAECQSVLEYAPLVGRKFYMWDGNHRVITWMDVSMSPEKTTKRPWHPRVRCVIMIPPVRVYKQIEVAMHNLNASSHATVQYDWIQDAERCLQVLSSPLIDYKEMIGDDVYEEFEKTIFKSTGNKAWYHANMTAMAATYILSFAEVTVAKESFHLIEEAEEKKQGKSLTAKQKKDMWDLKVKEVCGTWYNAVFKYATIVNPNLGPEFLSTVRELHNSLSRQPKAEREVVYNVGVDRVKAFAATGIHKDLKLELLKAHYSNAATKAKYHHPVANDIEIDILMNWLAPTACTQKKITFVGLFLTFLSGSSKTPPWWLEQRCADDEITFVADAEEICWESIKKEEDPYQVAKGKIAEADAAEQAEEAKSLEPNRKLEGLVLDTSRTKKQREGKQKMAADEDEGGTEGGTPTAKTGETKNPGSGRSSKTKSKGPKEEKARKSRRKKGEEEEVGPSHMETVTETAVETAAETAVEEVTSVAESAPPEERQPKRQKKQKWHDGLFRTDIYMPFNRPVVAVRTSLKITFDTIQSNKNKQFKVPVQLLDELKGMCTRIKDRRKQGFVINKKNVSTAADCLYLDMPTGWKLSEEDSEVPS